MAAVKIEEETKKNGYTQEQYSTLGQTARDV